MKIRYFWLLPLAAAVMTLVAFGPDSGTEEKYKLTPPTGFMKAEPGIIGVDSKGELTLDGWKADNPAYIVYFKWGSLIAMKGNRYGDWNDGIDDIAWVPQEYRSKLGNITDYASVPYADSVNYPDRFPRQATAVGLGDPCHFAKKDGVAGGYRMPTGNPYEQFTYDGWEESGGTFGQPGIKSTEGQFYPAAGHRYYGSAVYVQGKLGYYWSSSPSSDANGYSLTFVMVFVHPSSYSYNRSLGFAVRCVRK